MATTYDVRFFKAPVTAETVKFKGEWQIGLKEAAGSLDVAEGVIAIVPDGLTATELARIINGWNAAMGALVKARDLLESVMGVLDEQEQETWTAIKAALEKPGGVA